MQNWEYMFVDMAWNKDSIRKVCIVNDVLIEDWEKGQTLYEYAMQLGEDGWELIGDVNGTVVFKRPKS